MDRKFRAIALVSGGLDSALAVAVVRRLGVDVVGLHVLIGYSSGFMRREIAGERSRDLAAEESARMSAAFGVPVQILDCTEEYFSVLLHPRHGYGANANPCIDCHLFMIGKAKEVMEREGAHFVFTGEVLGQRPMSQNYRALELIDGECGLGGLLVRPLSAKLLPETLPERNGWLSREGLLDIQGRSRRRQMELASELGVTGYSSPAGGCMLTDENYAAKVKDWMRHRGEAGLTHEETLLFSVGRHFRLSPFVKIVVGRREAENLYIERAWRGQWLAAPLDGPGPTVLVQGRPTEEDLRVAASFVARYSDAKNASSVRVAVRKADEEKIYEIAPAPEALLERCRI
ncbi:MAG TPA: thiamine biosynthesis protein [Candidatus Bathyarchaeia archaeon]|nr:thiamine biosynthesis protein [Candidatus Bathyarchaeia archaeon]